MGSRKEENAMDHINNEDREIQKSQANQDRESEDLGLLMNRIGRIKELILAITAFRDGEQK